MGTTIVNIRLSALPKIVPPKYSKIKRSVNRTGKITFRQCINVGMRLNKENTTVIPLRGNLIRVVGFW